MSQVKLGDVAVESRETYKGDKTGMPIVGLEHITPGEVTLSNWDTDTDNTFTKRFRKGDMLFGRRRAYLKKAAQAPFDGICSGDITVIRAKEDLLSPELLPFIIQNDNLFDFAVGKSAGSLSPRVKWDNLKNYTFELPSMEEQRKLAEVLWSINDTLQAYQKLFTETDALVRAQFIEMFGDPIENPMKWPIKNLSALGTCKNGMNFSSKEQEIAIRCVGVADIKDYNYIESIDNLTLLSLNEKPSEEYLLRDGDIVFVRSNGNKDLVGRCVAVYPGDIPVTFSGFCIRFRKESEDVLLDYLLRLLKLPGIRAKMAGRGANIQNLNQKILASLSVPIPPKSLQETYIQITRQSDKVKSTLRNTTISLQATKRCILDDALGTGRKE